MARAIEIDTTIHAPPAEVYAFLEDVEGFSKYSDHIRRVDRYGEGGVGTEFDITLAWWKLEYTARVRIVELDPPERIEWRLTQGLDAHGVWRVEPTVVDDPDVDQASNVTLAARFDPDSGDGDALTLPPFVPISSVVRRVRPYAEREAERVLARVVADLEGEPRQAALNITIGPVEG